MEPMRPSIVLFQMDQVRRDIEQIQRWLADGCFGLALETLEKLRKRLHSLNELEEAMTKEAEANQEDA